MTDRFQSAAEVVVTELKQRRAELLAELERVEHAIRAVAQFRGPEDVSVAQRDLPGLDLREMTYADAIEVLLKRADRQPLTTKVLLKRLEAAGRPVRGRDPYRILYRSLMKDRRFESVGGRWGLSDWYPDAVGAKEDSDSEDLS